MRPYLVFCVSLLKKLIDESSDVEMKIQMAETKIQMMEMKNTNDGEDYSLTIR